MSMLIPSGVLGKLVDRRTIVTCAIPSPKLASSERASRRKRNGEPQSGLLEKLKSMYTFGMCHRIPPDLEVISLRTCLFVDDDGGPHPG